MLSDAELLARLVGIDTTSHRSNLPLAELLADYLDRPGVRIVLDPSPGGDKANLLVFAGPVLDPAAAERPGLVLSGHMDVVPALEDTWSSDPFSLTDAGDAWVGRGTADMKGFLALAANLMRRVDPPRLSAPLVLLYTYDEEVGTLGAHHLVTAGWATHSDREGLPRAAVIGEPTELEVVTAHKGHLKARVSLAGVGAHSGYPHLGVNAVEAAGRVIGALAALRSELEAERPAGAGRFPEVPFAALNVATVHGGTAVNVVPDRCVVELGARVLPGMESAALAERLRRAAASSAGVEHRFEVTGDSPPLAVDEAAPVVAALTELTGGGATRSVSYATDAGWLQRLGLDCAVFGPGSITVAHKPDEHLPKADLAAAGPLVAALARRFCGPGVPA